MLLLYYIGIITIEWLPLTGPSNRRVILKHTMNSTPFTILIPMIKQTENKLLSNNTVYFEYKSWRIWFASNRHKTLHELQNNTYVVRWLNKRTPTETILLMRASKASEPLQSVCSASVDKRFTNANTRDAGTWRRRLPISASRHCSAIGKSLAELPEKCT